MFIAVYHGIFGCFFAAIVRKTHDCVGSTFQYKKILVNYMLSNFGFEPPKNS